MMRSMLGGVAAIALLTGAAYAQDSTFYNRTETVSTPFGTSETRTTTTRSEPTPIDEEDAGAVQAPPPGPIVRQPPIDDERSADVGVPPPPPEPPSNYDQVTTTRQVGPDGVETRRTDSYRERQRFYDANGELSARTTTTRSDSTRYGPAPVYAPNPVAVGPAPVIEYPPYRSRTTTTTTTTHDGE